MVLMQVLTSYKMNKFIILLLTSCFSLSNIGFTQDVGCKVLMNGLDKTYSGDCKKDLANGQGIANGILGKYVGEFKKGFPHGTGKLEFTRGSFYEGEWSRGMRDGKGKYFYSADSIVDGYWQRNVYLGKYQYPYKVVASRGPLRYKITRIGASPYGIEVQFKRNGIRTMDDIVSISTQYNSGSQLEQNNYIGFEQVEFPFEGRFLLTINNTLRTNTYTADFEFHIYQAGKWIVTIDY